jgi:hypothetical protein
MQVSRSSIQVCLAWLFLGHFIALALPLGHPPATFEKPVSGGLQAASDPTSTGLTLILLSPTILIEEAPVDSRIKNAQPVPPIANPEEYQNLLMKIARQKLSGSVKLVELDTLDSSSAEACKGLIPFASRLARGSVNTEATNSLARVGNGNSGGHSAVLVQYIDLQPGLNHTRVQSMLLGPTPSVASTLIQVALISTDGRVLWKSEQFIRRKALKPNDPLLVKAIEDLYRDFGTK